MNKVITTLTILVLVLSSILMGCGCSEKTQILPQGPQAQWDTVYEDNEADNILTKNLNVSSSATFTGILASSGTLNVTGGITGMNAHGKMVGDSGTITLTNALQWYKYGSESTAHSTGDNITYDSGTHSLTVDANYYGHYTLSVHATISCDTANSEITMGLKKNGVIGTYGKAYTEVKFANGKEGLGIVQQPSLKVGDELTVWFRSDNAGDVIRIHQMNFTLDLIHRQ